MTVPTGTDPGITNIKVSGGAGGASAVYEDFGAMGRLTDEVGGDSLATAGKGHKYLVDPNVVASAVLDPVGAAKFESAMLGALDGPKGLTAVAGTIELRSAALRAAEAGYQLADEASAKLLEDLQWLAGAAALPVLPAAIAAALPDGAAYALAELIKNGGDVSKLKDDAVADLQRLITEHPGVVDAVVGGTPGALSLLQKFPVDLQQGATEIGLLMPDGKAHTESKGRDLDPTATTVPRNLGDVLAEINHRNTTAGNDGKNNGPNIDVRTVTGPDGKPHYIVDIPGTKVWNSSTPGSNNTNINDLGTNIHGVAGQDTALQQAVDQALRQAGATSTDPVMLVGHSQGGIIAANAAADWVNEGKYNVTNVITAGSPVGLVDMPSSVKVLSLENSGDIVAHLDGRSNPATGNWTTVTFDHQTGAVFGNHSLGEQGYTGVARQLSDPGNPASKNPSVAAFNQSLAENGFTTGTSVETHQYYSTRVPD
ncbi:conserved hypothetical protein [Segniliparus rotundus DSM 44985]|uniref:PGAP1 family protein n=1 Tax=Segniliparus rotundus (strain ATCC BAA-972 / CDC 1076 / CIP 108378 / DSM 44985 / JCM 13578) TaxID=640132 RepID=D6Z897_SEGRD|nr:Mbeg1-like protein [Segniliparus rotundus]ADG98177.1 conserved hypothetical protein [Segniliparus rotundus DSM 44985]